MMRSKITFILFSAAIVATIGWHVSSTHTPPCSIFSQMQQAQPLEMTIEADWSTLMANKHSSKGLPASVSYTNANGITHHWNAKVKTRGKTRLALCDFPPLKLQFDARELRKAGLQAFSSLKLVTQCKADEQLLLKEYLAYQLYNKLTEKSFKVQLARITYRDQSGKQAPFQQYALIMENTAEMASRLGGRLLETAQSDIKTIDASQYRLLTVFQYMIGNTDWNLNKQHNIRLVKLPQMPAPTPIPYDFDHAGLVNAPYAKPHPQLPISKVTQRLFQWRGQDPESLQKTLRLFRDKKNELLQTVNTIYGLSPQERQSTINYLESFFEVINSKAIKGHAIVSWVQEKGAVEG